MNARKEIENLRAEIAGHDHRYYVLAQPSITDQEYDVLFKRLKELETQFPEYDDPSSPTHRIGDALTSGFKTVQHPFPLISLDNSYDEQDIRAFHARVLSGLGKQNVEYVCELKFDGVAVILKYENQRFVLGATRGDGELGDDITLNLKTIRALPLKLAPKSIRTEGDPLFFVRGEVYIGKAEFERFNAEREEQGEKVFANPRNFTAGSLKLLDPKVVAARPLSIVCYGYDNRKTDPEDTQAARLEYLNALGFPVSKHWRLVDDIDGVIEYWRHWQDNRDTLPFEVDGVVVKLNRMADQRVLGSTARSPRFAIAYKFSARQAKTRLNAILLQIGRTGVLTPVADLEPVPLGGITIRRATLHNFDEIERLDARVGDTVLLERGGDVIPKITAVDLSQRFKRSEPYKIPTVCPFCGARLVRDEGTVGLRCPNPGDKEVVKRQIEHFASRSAMDIGGLGSETVASLVDAELVADIGDLYSLKLKDVLSLDRFADRSAQSLIDNIEQSRSQSLQRLIFGLGIRFVGEETARTLAVRMGSLQRLASVSEADLTELPDVGPRVAAAIREYFSSSYAQRVLAKLSESGVSAELQSSAPRSEHLAGMSFVLTGGLTTLTREAAEEAIIASGGKSSSSVSKKTSYVIVGENPGSKFAKAQELGVPILSEADFIRLLEGKQQN